MFFLILIPNLVLFLLKERKKNTNIHINIIKIKKMNIHYLCGMEHEYHMLPLCS